MNLERTVYYLNHVGYKAVVGADKRRGFPCCRYYLNHVGYKAVVGADK